MTMPAAVSVQVVTVILPECRSGRLSVALLLEQRRFSKRQVDADGVVIRQARRQRVVDQVQSPGEVGRKPIGLRVITRIGRVRLYQHPVELELANNAQVPFEFVRRGKSFSVPLV